jgi:hypothetical protein
MAPMRLGLRTLPRAITVWPTTMSAPWRPTFCRGYTGVSTRTSPPAFSVSSTITTASAPSGIGAPVAISIAVPGSIAFVGTCPV